MAALTHRGRVRSDNEDALYFDPRHRTMIVCDGMGGHAGGHIASELAVRVTADALRRIRPNDWANEDGLIEAVKDALFSANDHILNRAHADSEIADMGTTITLCAFTAERVVTCNVGDSRIYRIADGAIAQISEDHSLVAERIRAGLMEPDSAEATLLGNIITRALGMEHVTIDITVEDLLPGDIYLQCTDGLCDMVTDEEMLDLVTGATSLEQACMALIDLANQRGGVDNITIGLTRADG
jgi:protein phosphatase